MKSLLDIQQDVRNLEGSVQEITKCIKSLNSDINDIKNDEKDLKFDFPKIELLAGQITFKGHPLMELKDSRACQLYLEMLLNIVHLDTENKISRMVFIQWIQKLSGIDYSLQELYRKSLSLDLKSYCELSEIIPEQYKEYFVVDALIAANINGIAKRKIYGYIVDIAIMFGISLKTITELAVIARIVLLQKVEEYEEYEAIREKRREYRHYISPRILSKYLDELFEDEFEEECEAAEYEEEYEEECEAAEYEEEYEEECEAAEYEEEFGEECEAEYE